eukprot:4477910-Pyramimonas_sp.AAC.1
MTHGTAVSPDRAEELRLADAVGHAAQRKSGLGRWRAAFPASVQYPENGLYPFASRHFQRSRGQDPTPADSLRTQSRHSPRLSGPLRRPPRGAHPGPASL